MELVSLAGEVLQAMAETFASYHVGQNALQYLDKALDVVEISARWALPTPLYEYGRDDMELIRPLPWVFFLSLLVILRLTREAISIFNLILGKPPVTSADVVIFVQGKRRYLRTLRYLGARHMRARTSAGHPPEPWYRRLQSLFEFTMCFRRNPRQYGNNNTTNVSNNDEVLVVQNNSDREDAGGSAPITVESTMERLIERMMVDLDADSDEDSGFPLTNATTGAASDISENAIQRGQNATSRDEVHNAEPMPDTQITNDNNMNDTTFSPVNNGSSTPDDMTPTKEEMNVENPPTEELSPIQETEKFIKNEISHYVRRTPKYAKFANGRTVKTTAGKKKGTTYKRRNTDVPLANTATDDSSF